MRDKLGGVVREVAHTGREAVITDNGREVAVIIALADYERLHEHADVVDALRLREVRSESWETIPLAETLDRLGVGLEEFRQRAG